MSGLRSAYVGAVRAARHTASKTGALARLDRSDSPRLRHVRTLFAIHDVTDLAELDLAWWSYPALRAVDEFLAARPEARVFEFGSGASTLWLARRAARVDSVEHDTGFAAHVRTLLAEAPQAELHAVPPAAATAQTTISSKRRGHRNLDFADYVRTIDRVGGTFDLVVVDGRARVECFQRALDHLEHDGVIVFDNIKRRRYWRAVSRLPGLHIDLYRGATPALPYPTTTGLIRHAT